MSNPQEKTQAKKVVKIVLNVLLWIFLAFALVTMIFAFISASNDYGVAKVGNKVYLNVVSPSMEPTIKKGDMIVGTMLNDEEKRSLKKGDIITFFVDLNNDGNKELNTHRIVNVMDNGGGSIVYTTKGDNNDREDQKIVRANDVVAIWHEGDTKIGGIGGFFAFLQSSTGFLLLIVLPLAAFFIYELVNFILLMVKLKKGDKKEYTPEEEAIRQKLYEEYLLKQAEQRVADAAQASREASAEETEPATEEAAEETVTEGSTEQAETTTEEKPEE